jgi:flagella basal body P-ring formation protein FlgA
MNSQKLKSCQLGILVTTFCTFCTILSPAQAQSVAEMMQIAQSYILKHLDPKLHNPTISLTPLSATAQTADCQHPPQVRWNSGQKTGNISLSIICTQPKWQRYINAKISGELPVVITNKDLALGAKITPEDVYIAWLPDTQIRNNNLTSLSDIENLSTRQFVSSGTALTSNQVRASVLVHKGDPLRIIVMSDGISIEMPGIALESGEKGKSIRIQNQSSGKIIKGNILSADSVVVP